jgi:hypothetical protein
MSKEQSNRVVKETVKKSLTGVGNLGNAGGSQGGNSGTGQQGGGTSQQGGSGSKADKQK